MPDTPDRELEGQLRSAQAALQGGNARAALVVLRAAEAAHPENVEVKLQLALAHRISGELHAAIAALDGALAIDPYVFLALLSKGSLLERLGAHVEAARIYRDALAIAPDPPPPALQTPLAQAREAVRRDAEGLERFVRDRLAESGVARDARPARFDQALDVFMGRKRVFTQQPLLLHYPELPAVQFYDRRMFPWLEALEAATGTIRAELDGILAEHVDDFAPYIAYPPGSPVNQWGELNHSRRWSSLWLWRDGVRQDQACGLAPKTAALLDTLPVARQPEFAPTVVFSALEPHTHIPPHTGSSNTRLLVHLPLTLPGPARFRVGNETRAWRMGEAWVFDDTIEHEAWNDAGATRTILIFDIWNPHLSELERELVTSMMSARRDYYATPRAP